MQFHSITYISYFIKMHIGSIFIAKVAKMAVGMADFVFCGG